MSEADDFGPGGLYESGPNTETRVPHTSTPQVHFEDGRYWVIYEGRAFAAFKPQDDDNAIDYCNGLAAGLSYPEQA